MGNRFHSVQVYSSIQNWQAVLNCIIRLHEYSTTFGKEKSLFLATGYAEWYIDDKAAKYTSF